MFSLCSNSGPVAVLPGLASPGAVPLDPYANYNTGISMAVTFDTLRYAEALKSAGVPDTQAKVQAQALAQALEEGAGQLAGKQDVEALRQEMKFQLADLKADLLKWVIGALFVQGSLVVALIKLI